MPVRPEEALSERLVALLREPEAVQLSPERLASAALLEPPPAVRAAAQLAAQVLVLEV